MPSKIVRIGVCGRATEISGLSARAAALFVQLQYQALQSQFQKWRVLYFYVEPTVCVVADRKNILSFRAEATRYIGTRRSPAVVERFGCFQYQAFNSWIFRVTPVPDIVRLRRQPSLTMCVHTHF